MATGGVSGCQTPRALPQDQCVCNVGPSARQDSAASPGRLRESGAGCPGDRQKVSKPWDVKAHVSASLAPRPHSNALLVASSQGGDGGWECHPLLGVGGDWVEPSDPRRPEERLLWGSAGGQKPHTTNRAALLEQQVRSCVITDAACPLTASE